jgi:hypothetical protein
MPPNECQRGGTGLPQGAQPLTHAEAGARGQDIVLSTEGLTKEFKGFRAVKLHAGDVAAVVADRAGRRRQELRQQVEAGRLAGAGGDAPTWPNR